MTLKKNTHSRSMNKKKFVLFNVLIIFSTILMSAGCLDNETKTIAGTYSDVDNNKTTLIIYDNNTFFNKERAGYLLGREINFTVSGTWRQEGDMVVFSGDGVTTTAYVQGENLIVEGSQYSKIKQ